MLYYTFHIGDYAASTPWMGWDEHCAYRMLLDLYYRKEQPIPLDRQDVYLLTMARTKRQKAAVDLVLRQFFTQTDHGWVNDRCERVLEEYRARGERAQQAGQASAAARRARGQQSDELAPPTQPSQDAPADAERASNDMPANAAHVSGTGSATVEPALNGSSTDVQHTANGRSTDVQHLFNQPITNNHEPITKKSSTPLAPSPLPDSTPPAPQAVDNPDTGQTRDPPGRAGAGRVAAAPVVLIPLQGKDFFGVEQTQIDDWAQAYPAVDVPQVLRNIREWCLSNPARKKTRKGVRAFVTSWLAREQDRGRVMPAGGGALPRRPPVEAFAQPGYSYGVSGTRLADLGV